MTQDSPSRRQDQFVLRLPDGMRERIADAARANNRSMNAEIVSRIQQSLDGQASATGAFAAAKLQLAERPVSTLSDMKSVALALGEIKDEIASVRHQQKQMLSLLAESNHERSDNE
nr:Arc family DNA-binding protein [Methylobacterium pseudosasicola]